MAERPPSDRSTDYRPGGKPFTGRKMLIVMLSFFAVIIGVNVTMAFLAVKDFRGTVVDSGFVASQDFNADRARFADQAARGWTVTLGSAAGRPTVALSGPDGAPLTGLSVAATAMWPLDQRLDRALIFIETTPGLYAAAEALPPGKWRLAFTADGAGPRYSAAETLVIDPDPEG